MQIRIFTENIRIFEIYGFFQDTDFFCRYGFLPKIYGFLKYTDFFPDTDFFCRYGFLPKIYGFLKYTDFFFPIRIFFAYTDFIRISTKLYGFIRIFYTDFFRKLYGLYGFFFILKTGHPVFTPAIRLA